MEIRNSFETDDVLSKLEVCNKYQNEIIQIKKENEELQKKEKMWEQKYIDQQRSFEHLELSKKNKELQEAESIINQQKETINILNIQQKDEIDALQKKLQSNKCALDAMKKTLDNEKAFRICADEEKKNLKEQIKFIGIKYKSLENENEKLISEKLKIEETKNKISQQCNELIEKNISLENHCEKKELAFDEQTNLINQLENNITEFKEKINSYIKTEDENNELIKQIKQFSKQMETYENEREVYVQRLQKMQREENELNCIIKDLKKDIDINNNKINNLKEKNSAISSENVMLSVNINNLQTNFTNCIKLLDEIFENYLKNQVKENKKVENNELLKFEPFLNETFDLFDQTLSEYKSLKSSYKESETTLKDEINKKDNIIKSLKHNINYKQDIIKSKTENSLSKTNHLAEVLNCIESENDTNMSKRLFLNDEFEKNLTYINEIKFELLPKQKLLVSEYKEFVLEKIKEIENLNISKNKYVENVQVQIKNLNNGIISKNITIKELKMEILKLGKRITEKDSFYNEMEVELQCFRDNLSTTSVSKMDEIYKLREMDESQDDLSQKLRAIALKQKKQIADLKQSLENESKTHHFEKNELLNKITALGEQSKLARCLQQQYDIKCDEYDNKCKEIKELVKNFKERENQLLEQSKLCTDLKCDIDTLKNDLACAQKTINSLQKIEKSLNSKLEVFKQEKSASEILKADRETSIKELTKSLKVSQDKVKSMESELCKLKSEKQKINIRDLELNSYEKTLDELSQKVKEEKLHCQNLEQELSNANNVIDSLHEQIKHLENIVTTEQERNKQNSNQIEVCRTGLNNAELLLHEKENTLVEFRESLNQEKILNTNLTNKYDQLHTQYETEKENYQLQHSQLTEKVRRLQAEINKANDTISKYMEENQSLLDEFEAYKVRAHSVFQKHKQDTVYSSKITELNEQLQKMTKAFNSSKTNLQNVTSELSIKNSETTMLQNEIDKYEKKLSNITKILSIKDKEIYRLSNEIVIVKSILEKEKASLNEKMSNEKLLHEKEIKRLQQEILLAKEANTIFPELNSKPIVENKFKESNSSNHIHDDDEIYTKTTKLLEQSCTEDDIIIIEIRIYGKKFSDFASSNESVRKISKSALMPLENLLSFENNISDPINEQNVSQKQLKQLTMMLNDAEKNCSRYEQQNKFLKEDIRRLQRNVDRHAEIQNMEYLKNIMIKFITLSSGVEKCHLVPVINKLLKLSPDEQKQIETIAKGSLTDQNSSWSSLFTWSQGT